MAAKRKRPASRRNASSNKRTKITIASNNCEHGVHNDHPVLKHYFPRVSTLREHLSKDLQDRHRLQQQGGDGTSGARGGSAARALARLAGEHDTPVARILDTVVVGCRHRSGADTSALRERRARDVLTFTQHLPSSTIGTSSSGSADVPPAAQLEVVDFVVWLLFRRSAAPARPQHLLAQGFDRLAASGQRGLDLSVVPGIPGLVCKHANPHVERVTSSHWCALLALLGAGGDVVMVDLLLECCLFVVPGNGGDGATRSLVQFSGIPLSSLQPCDFASESLNGAPPPPVKQSSSGTFAKPAPLPRLPSSIKFVRNRMFFAQPSLSANGKVKFGLHSIHVLNRYTNLQSEDESIRLLKYVFPRQFRMHNAFTSPVDPRESALPFKDYTLREAEIRRLLQDQNGDIDPKKQARVPKRLAGAPLELVKKLRKLHAKCAYAQLLKHYCALSTETAAFVDTGHMPSAITDLATPSSRVSAFCQAVVKNVVPRAFWGTGDTGAHNLHVTLRNVDRFVRARKFESFTLHTFLEGLRVADVPWLRPPREQAQDDDGPGPNMSRTDFAKRRELLAELVYYLFDSVLVPLVRSHFHVTESNVHRNRLFYFRHDVWRRLSAPALDSLRADLFEELHAKIARQRLAGRPFGYSTVRLLPKTAGFRPITNLRRRPYVWVNGKKMLGKSINSALNPAFRALNHEKTTHLDELGCSLFSVSDIYPRLRDYSSQLQQRGLADRKLYFAKVDVQACFDTIPQEAVLKVVNGLLVTPEYLVAGEARVKPPEATVLQKGALGLRPVVKFGSKAKPTGYMAEDGADDTGAAEGALGNGVLVAPLGQQAFRRRQVEDMVAEHVEFNLIKIGKRFYRQKRGIPQGSVLSSLLCNFFYGRLERNELSFLRDDPDGGGSSGDATCLLRLIDDFLLITTDRARAERFLRVMHRGLPEYGVSVKPSKSLASFDITIDGEAVPRADDAAQFPYCGLAIGTARLELSRSGQPKVGTTVSDSLTVEYSHVPGRTFRRKALNALKIQLHSMYFDTAFNGLDTALANLYKLFHDAASRVDHYMRAMPKHGAPSFDSVKGTIEDLEQLAYTMIRGRRRRVDDGKASTTTASPSATGTGTQYECAIRRDQAVCLARQAFRDVFLPRQTGRAALLDWLRRGIRGRWARATASERAALRRVVPTMLR